MITQRITEYLSLGGFFNPEAMDHDKVRDLLIDAREEIAILTKSQTDFRYSHDEIEAACGGETALAVRNNVMRRRASILAKYMAETKAHKFL